MTDLQEVRPQALGSRLEEPGFSFELEVAGEERGAMTMTDPSDERRVVGRQCRVGIGAGSEDLDGRSADFARAAA